MENDSLLKIRRLINEIELINYTIKLKVDGPQWQRLTLSKNDSYHKILAIIYELLIKEMEIYNTKYKRRS